MFAVPALDRLHGRQAIEGRVDLDRVERVRVELEPPRRRSPLRIEDASPVLVAPAGAANADHGSVYFRCALSVTAFVEVGSGKNARMPDSNPSETLPPKHDPFDAPDAEDEADTRERVL